jgi:uncharacterized membrane protein YgdD (TMEM256/DUF423 family)
MSESSLNAFTLGAFTAAFGILLGAFGAHALKGLPAPNLAWWSTGTQYLFIGAFGMMLDGLRTRAPLDLRSPTVLMAAGVLLFSGSLYAMALGAPRKLGMVTPVGGLALFAGFLLIGLRVIRNK